MEISAKICTIHELKKLFDFVLSQLNINPITTSPNSASPISQILNQVINIAIWYRANSSEEYT